MNRQYPAHQNIFSITSLLNRGLFCYTFFPVKNPFYLTLLNNVFLTHSVPIIYKRPILLLVKPYFQAGFSILEFIVAIFIYIVNLKHMSMKRVFTILCFLLSAMAQAQTSADYVVQLTAQVQKSPAQITLNWPLMPGTGSYIISRKAKNATSWGTALGTAPANATSFTDNNVVPGETYEYEVLNTETPAYGYILAGIEAAPLHSKGALLLLVDSTFTDSCAAEIAQLIQDISGDGWQVSRKDYNRAATAATIKNDIVSTYQANSNLKSLLILGHLAVPYSGDYNTTNLLPPDGHTDHAGAWPADVFYGELNSTWTDNVTNQLGTRPANENLPGDGKYDQTKIPGEVELQVGRIDMANMPSIPRTEIEMMRNYLNKAHDYKTGNLTTVKRALIDDNFGKMNGEGFAAAAYRLSPIVHRDSISQKDFIPTLKSSPYLWAFGCGAGSFTNCNGVAHTDSFKTGDIKGIFTMMFGSYFGDWNVNNNLLRAPLCAEEPALTSCWSGRPHWFFHQMAMGENIGYSTIVTQNNYITYSNKQNIYTQFIHTALMGDPTLRTEYVKPVPSVSLVADSTAGAIVSWTASPESGLAGYYVYRSTAQHGEYQLRSGLVTGTSFTDSFGNAGAYWYMVRATKLQSTPSGSYYNLSLGMSQQGTFKYPKFEVGVAKMEKSTTIQLVPNPARETVQLRISSTVATIATIITTDMQGKTLHSANTSIQPGNNVETLNISQLSAGVYFVNIQSRLFTQTLKLCKTQ